LLTPNTRVAKLFQYAVRQFAVQRVYNAEVALPVGKGFIGSVDK